LLEVVLRRPLAPLHPAAERLVVVVVVARGVHESAVVVARSPVEVDRSAAVVARVAVVVLVVDSLLREVRWQGGGSVKANVLRAKSQFSSDAATMVDVVALNNSPMLQPSDYQYSRTTISR
jgi:hypothetical protein